MRLVGETFSCSGACGGFKDLPYTGRRVAEDLQRRSKLHPVGFMLVVMPVVLPQLSEKCDKILHREELPLTLSRRQPVFPREFTLDVLSPSANEPKRVNGTNGAVGIAGDVVRTLRMDHFTSAGIGFSFRRAQADAKPRQVSRTVETFARPSLSSIPSMPSATNSIKCFAVCRS